MLEKYFWSAPNRSGEQGTVTEGEMVGCIIGLSTLSATKPLEIFKYSEYFGVKIPPYCQGMFKLQIYFGVRISLHLILLL